MHYTIILFVAILLSSCTSTKNTNGHVEVKISQSTPYTLTYKITNNLDEDITITLPLTDGNGIKGEHKNKKTNEWESWNQLGANSPYFSQNKNLKPNEVFYYCINYRELEILAGYQGRCFINYTWNDGENRDYAESNSIVFMGQGTQRILDDPRYNID